LNPGQAHVGWRSLFLYGGDKEHHNSNHPSRAWLPFLPAKATGKKGSPRVQEATGASFHESARHAFADNFLPKRSGQTDANASADGDAQAQANSYAAQIDADA